MSVVATQQPQDAAQLQPPLTQPQFAQKMYTTRASAYENSWHPSYSARLMGDVVRPQPGENVLVLACGTGLESFIAAREVGPGGGRVVGVDVTPAMLTEARGRLERERQQEAGDTQALARMDFVEHDITDLDTCAALKGQEGKFDVLVCSCAFVLLDEPDKVVRHWKKWLYQPPTKNTGEETGKSDGGSAADRPAGRLVIDITHESNQAQGLVIEAVAREMGVPFHSNRLWIKNKDSFRTILETEGYAVDQIEFMDKVAGDPVSSYGADQEQADKQFDYVMKSTSTGFVWEGVDLERARELFRQKWAERCVDGRVEVVDGLYIYVARP
ncbi:S-adenosyl-L-methionine-dependent methyltransferase [Microdochium trichocladiopsis]|uniref:S-adenosyl-L-methionine-dependent methyltransferase n=1 Tax=Microdochium trichocladiopsis TaxID=1682393 RepID=A0A9P8XVA9_9PEZI|nr:S-adenosyl-L-methionine-dependent methyltransferase [Microdochium trichocladiopsis]KAH7020838.1 S-adenosyl-L-methionine-dependent methyltransferase [Microdochium trichocladiopsis]